MRQKLEALEQQAGDSDINIQDILVSKIEILVMLA